MKYQQKRAMIVRMRDVKTCIVANGAYVWFARIALINVNSLTPPVINLESETERATTALNEKRRVRVCGAGGIYRALFAECVIKRSCKKLARISLAQYYFSVIASNGGHSHAYAYNHNGVIKCARADAIERLFHIFHPVKSLKCFICHGQRAWKYCVKTSYTTFTMKYCTIALYSKQTNTTIRINRGLRGIMEGRDHSSIRKNSMRLYNEIRE